MAQVHVRRRLGGEHRDDGRGRRPVSDAAERLGREEARARRVVREERNEGRRRRRVAQIADHLRSLRADLRVAVGQERGERRGGLAPSFPVRASCPIPQMPWMRARLGARLWRARASSVCTSPRRTSSNCALVRTRMST